MQGPRLAFCLSLTPGLFLLTGWLASAMLAVHPYPYPYPYAITRTTASHTNPFGRCSGLHSVPAHVALGRACFVNHYPFPRRSTDTYPAIKTIGSPRLSDAFTKPVSVEPGDSIPFPGHQPVTSTLCGRGLQPYK